LRRRAELGFTLWANAWKRLGYLWGPRLMSALRKQWVLLRHRHVDIRFEGPVYLGPGFSLHSPEGASFVVGPGVEFRRGFRAELGPRAKIRIGGGTHFTYDVVIQCGTTIDIGERCIFGQGALVVDGSHRFREHDRPIVGQGYDFRSIRIEDDAAVMAKCTVIANVGRHAFIGANSVVTRDIPAYTLAVGAPARAIDYFGPETERPPEPPQSRSDRSG
jgi:acetyltransferase-like isoleucine patch superfamily enzyme